MPVPDKMIYTAFVQIPKPPLNLQTQFQFDTMEERNDFIDQLPKGCISRRGMEIVYTVDEALAQVKLEMETGFE